MEAWQLARQAFRARAKQACLAWHGLGKQDKQVCWSARARWQASWASPASQASPATKIFGYELHKPFPQWGRWQFVELLLFAGADPQRRCDKTMTALESVNEPPPWLKGQRGAVHDPTYGCAVQLEDLRRVRILLHEAAR
eukprot:gene24141-biopygen11884